VHPIVVAAEADRRIQSTVRLVGITRIDDPTGRDPGAVHIFSEIRPTDAELGGISVYNGKVLAKADSRDRAMTNAVQRHRTQAWPGGGYRGTYLEVRNRHPEAHVMDPAAMRTREHAPVLAGLPLDWVDGWDLLDDCPAIVPANFVLRPFGGPGQEIWAPNAYGLASGGCVEEAASRALAELIERDACAAAATRVGRLAGPDGTACPLIAAETVPDQVRGLIRRAERDGDQVWLRDLTSDIGIPTLAGFVRASRADGTDIVAAGLGCACDPAVAAAQAVTEARQCRAACLRGATGQATAVTAAGGWEQALCGRDQTPTATFPHELAHHDAGQPGSLNVMLARLTAAGIRDAYAVDLTDPEIPVCVARVIVPELDSSSPADVATRSRRRERRSHGSLPAGYRVVPRSLERNVHA
jgi:ribosomal protein S12 methylthiotransferase accessory factor